MERWTVDDVIQWLKVNGLEKYSQTFIDADIDGAALKGLDDHEIAKLFSEHKSLRVQRKFRKILEEYRAENEQDKSLTTRATKQTETVAKTHLIEPTDNAFKFFKNENICLYLMKYFSKKYKIKCEIPRQDPYEIKTPIEIILSGNKTNIVNVQKELDSIFKRVKTFIFNDENIDKRIIRWSTKILTDRALIVLQNVFFNKQKLTIWEKTDVLSGYYIVYYPIGQHGFCSNKEFIRQILLSEISFLEPLIISDLNQKQNKFKTEFEHFLNEKKEQQTMVMIYYQYPLQNEIKINFFGLKNQISSTKRQLQNLIDKHKLRTLRIGLIQQQREYIFDNYVQQLKTIEFNYKDDNVKLKIREDVIHAPQYLIREMKQLVLSMFYQQTSLNFQYIEHAIAFTNEHRAQIEALARNYNCQIENIQTQTKREYNSLPRRQTISSSKYITKQSNEFSSSVSIPKIISIGKNTIEMHRSCPSTIDLMILSTMTDAENQRIDPNDGNGYFELDSGQKILYIQLPLSVDQDDDTKLKLRIKKFVLLCFSQFEIYGRNPVETIAFSITDWETLDYREMFIEELIKQIKNQLESEQYADLAFRILFILNGAHNEFLNEFSKVMSSYQADEDQFLYPISTTSIQLKASGNENMSRCQKSIQVYVKNNLLKSLDLNQSFDPNIWNQSMINTFYKYCLDHSVLPKIKSTQCLTLIGSILEVDKAREKYFLMTETEKLRQTNNSTICLDCCFNDKMLVDQLAQRLMDENYTVVIDYVNQQTTNKNKLKIDLTIVCFSWNYSQDADCLKSMLTLKESKKMIVPIFFTKISFNGQEDWIEQVEAEEWFYVTFEQSIQFRLTENSDFQYDKLIIELMQLTKFGKANRNYGFVEEMERENDLEEGYFGHEDVSLRFTETQIEEKKQIYQQKISQLNRFSTDELNDIIESLELVLDDPPTETPTYFEELLFNIRQWIEKAKHTPMIKDHIPPFTLTGNYNDAKFAIVPKEKTWWEASADADQSDDSKAEDKSLEKQILDGWCNYDETEQYFRQLIDREIQFREIKEKERGSTKKNKKSPRHYPHFHTDMKKGVPAWDVTQNPVVRKLMKNSRRYRSNKTEEISDYGKYMNRLVEICKGIAEGTISKDEKKRLEIGNAKKTSEEMKKLNELDNPNKKWKKRQLNEKFISTKINNIIEWQRFCETSSK